MVQRSARPRSWACLRAVSIFASSSLDEYELARICGEGAPIDGFGIGTRMIVSEDAPFLDCAYKLQEYAGIPRFKKSEGKVTLPLIYLLRDAEPAEQEALRSILNADTMSDDDLEYTLKLMEKHGSVDEALRYAQSLADDAKAALAVFPDSPHRQALAALADYVVQREK